MYGVSLITVVNCENKEYHADLIDSVVSQEDVRIDWLLVCDCDDCCREFMLRVVEYDFNSRMFLRTIIVNGNGNNNSEVKKWDKIERALLRAHYPYVSFLKDTDRLYSEFSLFTLADAFNADKNIVSVFGHSLNWVNSQLHEENCKEVFEYWSQAEPGFYSCGTDALEILIGNNYTSLENVRLKVNSSAGLFLTPVIKEVKDLKLYYPMTDYDILSMKMANFPHGKIKILNDIVHCSRINDSIHS